jgi:hypothetical protein
MSLWSKLRGTYETIFQIGKGGPNLKNATGVIEARNAADGAYALMRSLAPPTPGTTGNDVPNMTYFKSSRHVVKVAVALVTAESTEELPDSVTVTNCWIEVETPYTAGATLTITRKGDATVILQAVTDNDLQTAGIYEVKQMTGWGNTGDGNVTATIAGAPAAGACTLYVECVEALVL